MSVVGLSMEGAQGVAAAMNALSQSVEQLAARQAANTRATVAGARASTQAASGMQSLAQQAQSGIQRVQGVAGAVQSLVSALGSHDRTAGLIASVAGTTAQFASMGSALGPGGAVIGGLVGLVTSLSSVVTEMQDVERAAREAATEIHNLAAARIAARTEERTATSILTGVGASDVSAPDLERRSEEARLRARAAEEEIARRQADLDRIRSSPLATAAATRSGRLGEAEAALEVARESLAHENAIVDGVRREVDARAAARREAEHMAELQAAEAEAARAEAAEYESAAEATAALDARHRRERARHGGSSDGDREAAARARASVEAADEFRRAVAAAEDRDRELRRLGDEARAAEAAAVAEFWAEQDDLRAAHDREVAEAALDAAKASSEHHRELLTETGNAAKDFATGYVSSIGEVIASWDALAEASRASGTTMLSTGRLMERGVTAIANNIAESVGGTMTSAFSSAVGAWLDGSKSFVEAAEEMAKGVIKALVQESIVQGVTELARGIADLASYRYDSAALHFAAAAAWAVVGGAAGAIGAATGAFGGGGKAEGASQREMADRDRERARDAPTGNAVINIYADGMPVTRSDFAAGMSRALRDTVRAGYLPAGALGR